MEEIDLDFHLSDKSSSPIICPHCEYEEVDDFEVFDPGVPHSMRCDGCRRDFHFALMECSSCGAESSFPWAHLPSELELSGLACKRCGRSYAETAISVDDESIG